MSDTPETPLSDAAILRNAYDLVARGWCQGDFAQNADGEEVGAEDPAACRWCLLGAIDAGAPDGDGLGIWTGDRNPSAHVSAALAELYANDPSWAFQCSVALWNDAPGRTQGQVLQVLKLAQQRAEALAA